MKKALLLTASHVAALTLGFAAGIYALPILIAPEGPALSDIQSAQKQSRYKAEFRRDLAGSDPLHWGEGTVWVGAGAVSLTGRLAPGPDYKLYLSPEFVDSKEAFLRVKTSSARAGDIRTFDNFIVALDPAIDIEKFSTVVVWCETFSMFISAARYR